VTSPPVPDSPPPPERYFSFLGFTIVRKADLLAASAFLISIITLIYQGYSWFSGAKINFYTPDRVFVFFDRYPDGQIFVRTAGDVTFTNGGDPGHNGVVREVNVTITVNKTGITSQELITKQIWISFPKIGRENNELKIDNATDAHPIQVGGGATVSQLIGFAPTQENCNVSTAECYKEFIDADKFIDYLLGAKTISFSFDTVTFAGPTLPKKTCTMLVTPSLIWNLSTNGWYVGPCTLPKTDP